MFDLVKWPWANYLSVLCSVVNTVLNNAEIMLCI